MKMKRFAIGFAAALLWYGASLALPGAAEAIAQPPTATQPVEATDPPAPLELDEADPPPSAVDPPAATDPPTATEVPGATAPNKSEGTGTIAEQAEEVGDTVEGALDDAGKQVEVVAKQVDESETAKQVSAGILDPIYMLAERMAFPWFYWLAFAAMATGVVSYALQLVLGKLIVLTRMGFSLSEILSDALGFVISLVGLVLTTQAATENSTFATSSFSVLSASLVGLVAGIIFYLWGQSQELAATRGRALAQAQERLEKKS